MEILSRVFSSSIFTKNKIIFFHTLVLLRKIVFFSLSMEKVSKDALHNLRVKRLHHDQINFIILLILLGASMYFIQKITIIPENVQNIQNNCFSKISSEHPIISVCSKIKYIYFNFNNIIHQLLQFFKRVGIRQKLTEDIFKVFQNMIYIILILLMMARMVL